jgi:hypothetical protein
MDELLVAPNFINLSIYEMILNLLISIIVGFWVSLCYQKNHSGLSYSQGFTHSLIITSFLTTLVVMVIGGSLTTAFALIGALAIIRFRTVLKDTKDLVFIFASLTLGMACGTSNYELVIVGSLMFGLILFLLYKTNYGSIYKSDFLIHFRYTLRSGSSSSYISLFTKNCSNFQLLNIEPSVDNKTAKQTYQLSLKSKINPESFVSDLNSIKGISEVIFVSSKDDTDY